MGLIIKKGEFDNDFNNCFNNNKGFNNNNGFNINYNFGFYKKIYY